MTIGGLRRAGSSCFFVSTVALALGCEPPPTPLARPAPRPEVATVAIPASTASVALDVASSAADAGPDADATTADADSDAPDAALGPLVVRDEPTTLPGGRVLRGPCVTPPVHASSKSRFGADPSFYFARNDAVDLDGDGTDDTTLFGGAERTTATIHLYVARRGCGYPVGTIETLGGFELSGTKTNGLADLTAHQDLCQPRTGTMYCTVTYKFDGVRYRQAAIKGEKSGGVF